MSSLSDNEPELHESWKVVKEKYKKMNVVVKSDEFQEENMKQKKQANIDLKKNQRNLIYLLKDVLWNKINIQRSRTL